MSTINRAASEEWFHRIKSATRDLVRLCGGVVRAGEITNTSKSEVSRWQSANDTDIIPISAVLALQAECGVPMITTVMADLEGRRLSDPESEGIAASTSCFRTHHAEFLRASADVSVATATALADGEVSAAEAEIVDRELADLERVVATKRQMLAGIKARTLRAVS
ncbi:hypothetical protein [Chelatococcus sp.]|uniref:hypothetical protein n=1 Tax=Chelatococcus sp. TaxID=1953771 RepID=UPI001ED0BAE6|nr:hypothetical protein [Chelatococcus sp.]MBX3543601.1 hypothetical protein [Chelatococcus sp.]